ncbi:MAG: ABC-type Fe(3+)-siderophore transport system permease component [Candidatus Methanohalarchaeum thermophilum]|uniref:ABC-type Fe(3+)-siderophore transport system permease component n=1 Tax=Methanohalarchaeum thermophilum TaxID=1903181 RepID=A0A1Q6DT16_METT1|nr:MAG: ABC-type Fe(3+)-siderophore transport system permease component [Candidatus Methanohalarchaeum thermophilum]
MSFRKFLDLEADKRIFILLLLVLTLVISVISVGLGAVKISPIKVIKVVLERIPLIGQYVTADYGGGIEAIILDLRVPRVILAVVVGAALATAGAIMQGLFKNPLADPYIVGLSSGSALGAAIAIVTGLTAITNLSIPVVAFLGGLITISIVYAIAKEGRKVHVDTLLLAGVAFSFLLSALTRFIMYFSGDQIHEVMFWVLGGLTGADWNAIMVSSPVVFLGVIASFPLAKYLDAIMLGEEDAMYLGVDVDKIKKVLLADASLITAIAVAYSGVIGFVGLIPPHIVRIIIGPKHKSLIPASALLGALFLVLSDIFARMVLAPTEIPVGIITAISGAPFFIYLLWRRKKGK